MTPETAQLIGPREELACVFDGAWPAMPNNVTRACRALLASLRAEDLGEQTVDAIGVAVTEAATNSVYHAYVGRRVGQFRISATIEADAIRVSVEDDGAGFDDAAGAPAGRGVSLIASVADRIETSSRRGSGALTTMWFGRTG